MKKQSIYGALIAMVAMGAAFVSCTNVDNPYNPTPSDGKYVMSQDSVVYTNGDVYIKNWEYDDEGNMVKETINYCYADGTTDQVVGTYTYTPDLITSKATYLNGDTDVFYYRLNDKGLIEQLENATTGDIGKYNYSDDNRIISYSEDESKHTVTWKNGDVAEYDNHIGIAYFSYTNYEVNFPYLIYYVGLIDDILAQMGYFGKAPRHLLSNFVYDVEDVEGYSEHYSNDYSYVVLDGLVMEYTETCDDVITLDGETDDQSFVRHHYIKWEKR